MLSWLYILITLLEDFNWDTSLNLTYNTNEIVDLNSNIPMFRNEIAGENVIRLANGFPINTFMGM